MITPDANHQNNQLTDGTFALYASNDNTAYTLIPRNNYSYAKDGNGAITLTLNNRQAMRYLKLHVNFDDRDNLFQPVNRATFLDQLALMLTVYQESPTHTEAFQYDSAGNRTLHQITLVQSDSYTSMYYANSDRLKTNGKYAFKYDNAGNLIAKGNQFTVNGDQVTLTTTGTGVEYWQYNYDLLNRLIQVTKNGTIVSIYGYDPDGLRVVKKANGVTTHYVFEGTEPIFQKNLATGATRSYVYALGKHLARVDGVIGDPTAKVYYYHTDYEGSVRVITDQGGNVVFNADYYAFGAKYISNGDFDEEHGFTGKEWDPDVGLYYFNARWYDPELGRFISEDPAADPNNCNLYSYCGNNPIVRSDPTGQFWWLLIMALLNGIENSAKGGSFFGGFCQGAITSFAGGVVGSAVSGAVDGAFGMSAATNLGISTLSGAVAGGITGSLMGGNFWSGFVSGGVGGFMGVVDAAKGNDFFAHIKNWFNGAFGQFVASGGKYQFGLSDAANMSGLGDYFNEPSSTGNVIFDYIQKTFYNMVGHWFNNADANDTQQTTTDNSASAQKLTNEINKVINEPDTQPGYPDTNGNTNTTWCNRAGERICTELGYDTTSILNNSPSGTPDIGWTSANNMADNAKIALQEGIIQEVNPSQAYDLANEGIVVLALQHNSTGGHVGVVAPDINPYNPVIGPFIGQAGSQNGFFYASDSFAKNYEIHYYVLPGKN